MPEMVLIKEHVDFINQQHLFDLFSEGIRDKLHGFISHVSDSVPYVVDDSTFGNGLLYLGLYISMLAIQSKLADLVDGQILNLLLYFHYLKQGLEFLEVPGAKISRIARNLNVIAQMSIVNAECGQDQRLPLPS